VPPAPEFQTFSVRTERAGMVIGVPFAPAAVYRLDGDGGLWHGHGSEFRVVRSTLDGDTLMEIVLNTEPAPVTAAELAEWEAGQSIARFRDMGGRIDMSRIPSSKPHFDEFVSDPDGNLWVSLPGTPGQIHFAIFDGDGRYLGRLRIDGAQRENAVAPVIRNGRLHVVGRDDLDVQRVYVFRIER
jgi:hypothetical protein